MPSAEWLKANAADYGPDAGEFSWGAGLTPPGLDDEPPSRGGRYRGKAPATPDHTGLRALADELAERHTARSSTDEGRS